MGFGYKSIIVSVAVFIVLALAVSPVRGCRWEDLCKTCWDVAGENYTDFQGHCLHKPVATNNTFQYDTCRRDVVAMYLSWVAYEHDEAYVHTGREWNSTRDARLVGCAGNFKLVNHWYLDDDQHFVHLMFFINEVQGTAVFAIEGTVNKRYGFEDAIKDWMANLDAKLTDCTFDGDCGRIHNGFSEQWSKVREFASFQASKYINAGYELIITGHSKGGAMATLAAYDIKNSFPNAKVRLYAFAAPRTGDDGWASAVQKKIPHSRYIAKKGNSKDIATQAPPRIPFFAPYAEVGQTKYVDCDSAYFGNPTPVDGVEFFERSAVMPAFLGCHYQQVYLEGVLKLKTSEGFPNI